MIFYFSYFDYFNSKDNRKVFQSAINKSNYIAKKLEKIDKVTIVSLALSQGKNYSKKEVKYLSNMIKLIKFYSLSHKNKFSGWLDDILLNIQLIFFVFLNVKKNDKILVYHSTSHYFFYKFLKKIMRVQIIVEVEELYGIATNDDKLYKKELNFFENADAFVFSTELLNEKINKDNKPFGICYGDYDIYNKGKNKFNDGKIHCVYAGTFDPIKGGVYNAIKAARHLTNRYCIHILGFGETKDIDNVKELIKKTSKITECTIDYLGCLKGSDYTDFLSKCDIGLSTQIPDKGYNDTSFPSKILSYLSNGLKVVTIKLPVLLNSKLNDSLYYYAKNNDIDIANAILSIDNKNNLNGEFIVKKLDKEFEDDLKVLFNSLYEKKYS